MEGGGGMDEVCVGGGGGGEGWMRYMCMGAWGRGWTEYPKSMCPQVQCMLTGRALVFLQDSW